MNTHAPKHWLEKLIEPIVLLCFYFIFLNHSNDLHSFHMELNQKQHWKKRNVLAIS